MNLYAATWAFLKALPVVQEWPELSGLLHQVTQSQPRHWRLPVLSCTAVGGAPERAIPAVAAVGCLYLAIVLVDDMLDADPRGQHTTLGYPFTANLVSALQATGLEAIRQSNVPSATQAAIVFRLNRMVLRTALGQYWDGQRLQGEEDYWRVVRMKSAPFFATALSVGALVGGAGEETADGLEAVGAVYGEMIQINDDLNDVLAEPASPDWREKRSPLPILFAEQVLHPAQARFRALRQRIEEEGALHEAQAILIRCGAVSYCIDQLLQRHQAASDFLHRTFVAEPAGIQQLLDEVVDPAQRLLAQVRQSAPV